MTSRYETSETTKTIEAFNDGPLLAELLRVYNKKRAFCGQSRLDYGTPATEIFKNATNYANGPVDGDINTDAGARDANATYLMLIGFLIAIPHTIATSYISGADRYIWVNEGTDEPLELPESWAGGLTITALRETHNWHSALTGMIDAINAMQEMRVLVKPTVIISNKVITNRYVTYSLEQGPEGFVVQAGRGPLSTTTRMRPLYSSAALDDRLEAVPGSSGGVLGSVLYYNTFGGSSPNRWSFSASGFESSEYFVGRGISWEAEETGWKLADHGTITEDFLGVAKIDFTTTVNVPVTGNYNVGFGVFIDVHGDTGSKPIVVTFDGDTHSFATTAGGYFSTTFARNITAPSKTFTCSIKIDISIDDFWGGTPVETFDSDMRIMLDTVGDVYTGVPDTGDGRGIGAGCPNYLTLPFTTGFVPNDVGIPDNGNWTGKAKYSDGVPFTVTPSSYTLHYKRKIYQIRATPPFTTFIGATAT